MMEQIMNYVQPELIVVAIVLYFCGMGLKQTQTIKDKYIPLILGASGIVLCGIGFWQRVHWGTVRRLQWLYLRQSFREF